MLRDVYWRQYPVDLLSDDKMACVEAELPSELRYAPYMFYCAALKLCDNDGVFDLDDGVIMARLMRVNDPSIVFNIANLMRKRKIIYRLFDDSMLCGLVDWTYSDKKPRTIEERRRAVADAIKQKQANASSSRDFMTAPVVRNMDSEWEIPIGKTAPAKVPDFIKKCKTCEAYDAAENACTDPTEGCCQRHWKPTAPTNVAPKAPAQEVETAPAQSDFLCPENDKNAKNVVMGGMDDKNAKNVVTLQDNTGQDNKTEQTYSTDIQTNTHTQQQATGSGQLESPPPEACENINAVGVENIQNSETENPNIPTADDSTAGVDVSSLAEQALREARKDVEDTGQASLMGYLNAFFVKNCYYYKQNQSANVINQLAGKVLELSDESNPPGEVASVMCSEFKKMCEGQRGKHWKDMPVLPARMINPNVWAVLCQHAGKILASNSNRNKFIAAAEKAQKECEEESQNVGDALRAEYLKYNIDPDDPDAAKKIIAAKAQEQAAEREKSDMGFDIF